ncbi:MAG: hypothetical protein KA004_06470 [Verrucomicrobiales bacterium]|nr:hypothetical protein [Verrucomicrobiales bacterium]
MKSFLATCGAALLGCVCALPPRAGGEETVEPNNAESSVASGASEFSPEQPPQPPGEAPAEDAAKAKLPARPVLPATRTPSRIGITKSASPAPHGPIFRIPGAEATAVARTQGYRFSPAGGIGALDGLHTQARQFPNIVTSEVDGPRMMQLRPAAGWAIPQIANTFYMFTDARLQPAPLASGWRLRGIRLSGPNWMWAGRPQSGAPSASFALTLVAYRNRLPATIVTLDTLILEGPPGARDWRQAFVRTEPVRR